VGQSAVFDIKGLSRTCPEEPRLPRYSRAENAYSALQVIRQQLLKKFFGHAGESAGQEVRRTHPVPDCFKGMLDLGPDRPFWAGTAQVVADQQPVVFASAAS